MLKDTVSSTTDSPTSDEDTSKSRESDMTGIRYQTRHCLCCFKSRDGTLESTGKYGIKYSANIGY